MKKRMSWRREVRWLLAAKLILWATKLMAEEMSAETARALATLGQNMKNDPRFDTVPMKPTR